MGIRIQLKVYVAYRYLVSVPATLASSRYALLSELRTHSPISCHINVLNH